MSRKISTKTMTAAGLFAALTCVATIAIRIPIPGTGGYIHPGDAFVILSGLFLGPLPGALAAGIGSAFADLFGGYLIYAPVTFIIKASVAFFAGIFYKELQKRSIRGLWGVIAGGITDILLISTGYFVCEIPMYGLAAAALSVPANVIQGGGGLIIALVLYPALLRMNIKPHFCKKEEQ